MLSDGIKKIFLGFIKAYRYLISPLFPPTCKYYPTCSSYAKEAFETLPIYKAVLKSLWRILRCNPFSKGGYDPVTHMRGDNEN